MAILPDKQKELPYLEMFKTNRGRDPQSPEDWRLIYQATYGSNIPDEYRNVIQGASGISGLTQQAGSLGIQMGGARENYQNLAAGAQQAQTSAPSYFSTLQRALKKKIGTQDLGIGRSDLFEQAGLKGYGSLSQSLSIRAAEIGHKYDNYNNFIKDMMQERRIDNQQLIDAANNALSNYQMIKDEWDDINKRIYDLQDREAEYDNELKLYQEKARIDAMYRTTTNKSKTLTLDKAIQYNAPWAIGMDENEFINALYSDTPPVEWSGTQPAQVLGQIGEKVSTFKRSADLKEEASNSWKQERLKIMGSLGKDTSTKLTTTQIESEIRQNYRRGATLSQLYSTYTELSPTEIDKIINEEPVVSEE